MLKWPNFVIVTRRILGSKVRGRYPCRSQSEHRHVFEDYSSFRHS
jgi:hypothetical protein